MLLDLQFFGSGGAAPAAVSGYSEDPRFFTKNDDDEALLLLGEA